MIVNNNERLVSLDTLRGFDMMFIMGFEPFLLQLLSALGCSVPWLGNQFGHVDWHGLHFQDTIFPLFLFLAGVTWPFSLAKRRERGDTTAAIVRKIVCRGLVLCLLGFVYNGICKFDFANFVWGAVLVRIGLAWMIAALLSVFFGLRTRIAIAVTILLVHWTLCVFVTAPDAPGLDPLSVKGCFAGWLDRMILPGKLTLPGVISNQGVLSTFTGAVTAMLGVFAGELLKRNDLSGDRKALALAVSAVILVAAGCLMAFGLGGLSMPINKKLWSSSFVLVVGGYSAAMLALFYWLIDVRKWWKHTLVFRVIGMNSITIYMANRIMGFKIFAVFFFSGLASLLPDPWAKAVILGAVLGFEWLFLYILYRQKLFLRV